MKCLIFSDSHGVLSGMRRALRLHPDADAVFFLGDGLSDLTVIMAEFPLHTYFAVRGNCDFTSFAGGLSVKKTDSVILEGKKIVFTHGDLFGVKFSLDALASYGQTHGADILLFGHTHVAFERYCPEPRPHYFFNPGSVGSSDHPSFGILNLTGTDVLFSHGLL